MRLTTVSDTRCQDCLDQKETYSESRIDIVENNLIEITDRSTTRSHEKTKSEAVLKKATSIYLPKITFVPLSVL